MSILVATAAELDARFPAPGATGPARAVVMTMGALHDGHAELMRVARREVGPQGVVIATVFVNPTQFGPGEDFERYPRTIDDDVELCGRVGVDAVFAPAADEVYGEAGRFRDDSVTVDPGPLGSVLEGASRPGHFRGVLTVVSKLMSLTRPDLALFGEKDYQQLALISRMVVDLSMRVRVLGVATVREADGLALSSRNRYLDETQRSIASVVPRALEAVVDAASAGSKDPVAAGLAVLAQEPGFRLDYLELRGADLGEVPAAGPARVLIAGYVGQTRLIDNMAVQVTAS